MANYSYWMDWALHEAIERGRQEARNPRERAARLLEELAEVEAEMADLRGRLVQLAAQVDDGEWHH